MTFRHFAVLGLVARFAFPASTASAQKPIPPQSWESAEAQDQTVRTIRNVGTALFNWLEDQVDNNPDAAFNQAMDNVCISYKGESDCEVLQIDRIPLVSYQELTRMLVPTFIDAIPERDGWGHPYEFRVQRKYVFNHKVIAIRSPGSNGVFSGNRYLPGVFAPGAAQEDVVWVEGFFIRWPERNDIKGPKN